MKIAQSCPTLCDPMDYIVHGILQARILEYSPGGRGSSQSKSPALQVDSLLAEPSGKPKNTGAGSLSLLQQIFSTQELNQGLLHCRQILYQLSYQGSTMQRGLWKLQADEDGIKSGHHLIIMSQSHYRPPGNFRLGFRDSKNHKGAKSS